MISPNIGKHLALPVVGIRSKTRGSRPGPWPRLATCLYRGSQLWRDRTRARAHGGEGVATPSARGGGRTRGLVSDGRTFSGCLWNLMCNVSGWNVQRRTLPLSLEGVTAPTSSTNPRRGCESQGRSSKIISIIKWIRTSRLSIDNSFSASQRVGAAAPEKVLQRPKTDAATSTKLSARRAQEYLAHEKRPPP